jgi:hypothetical protein
VPALSPLPLCPSLVNAGFLKYYFKIELTTKLTEKELVTARNLFLKDPRKSFDNDYNRIITREHFNRVHHDLISSLKYMQI